ncbi:MAG: ester cyclase [bacterium]|nr:ester cyclase [bacterium]
MNREQAKTLVGRHFDVMWNRGDVSVAAELCAPDVVQHDPLTTRLTDMVAYVAYLGEVRQAFPDLVLAIEDVVAEGDKVVVRWTFSGTHRQEMRGLAATGRKVTFAGMSMYRLAGDRIAEIWTSFDTVGYLRQVMSLPGVSGAA